IGIAVIIFYKADDGGIIPYLPKRATKNQAVFHDGYHCTASGETMWHGPEETFDEIFTNDICRELQEEVGIERDDLVWIYPISLCREFLRGGKPQIFFFCFTRLPPGEINRRRQTAILKQIRNGRQEVENEELIAANPYDLYEELEHYGTIEAIVNMFFARKCAE